MEFGKIKKMATDLRLMLSGVTSKMKSVTQVGGCFNVVLPGRRGEDGRLRAVGDIEHGMNQIEVLNEVDRSTAAELRVEQWAVRSDKTLTVALALVGVSLAAICNVPGGVNKSGRAVMDDTIPFLMFLVADVLTFHASSVVVMLVATVSHLSSKDDYFIRIALWASAMCMALTFHAAAYVVVLPDHKWIVCFAAAAAMELSLFLLFAISRPCSLKFS